MTRLRLTFLISEHDGGLRPTSTDPDSTLIKAQMATYRRNGIEPMLWPRLAGSWPGVTFTGAPLKLAAGPFSIGASRLTSQQVHATPVASANAPTALCL